MKKSPRFAGFLAGLLLVLPQAPVTSAASSMVLSPEVQHYGGSYGDWATAWWQWSLAIPVHSPPYSSRVNHPLVDLTGTRCAVAQTGPVWFLGGAFFESGTSAASTIVRDGCSIPRGKALFFPLLNTECTAIERPAWCFDPAHPEVSINDVQTARVAVSDLIDLGGNFAADVDGTAIAISGAYRVDSERTPYCVTLPPDDLLTFIGEGPFSPTTSCGTVDDGYYVMLAPLASGAHTVHFHGELPAYGFTLDVTYHLTVG